MECKAVGTVSNTDAAALRTLLKGLSGYPVLPVWRHEMQLQGPNVSNSTPELRLLHDLDGSHSSDDASCSDRWVVRHEGLAVRGKAVAEAACGVRALLQASCKGAKVLEFWAAMGFHLSYELVKEGSQYLVLCEGTELMVMVSKVKRLQQQGQVDSATELTPDLCLVEVIAIAPEGQHVPAANAIGALGKRLLPLVELKKP